MHHVGLPLLHEYTLFAFGAEQAFETLLEEITLDTDVLDETFSLQLELVFFLAYSCLHEYNHAVLCYSCISL